MFSEEDRRRIIQEYLNSPSGQDKLKELGALGSRRRGEILDTIWRIIPKDDLPKGIKEDLGISPHDGKLIYEIQEELQKPENPGFFGDRPESDNMNKINEYLRKRGLAD